MSLFHEPLVAQVDRNSGCSNIFSHPCSYVGTSALQALISVVTIDLFDYRFCCRDGSLPHKGRFATFVRSCSALRASKRTLKISYLKSACLITPFGRWNQVNPTIFEICLLYENNNNKYSYEKFLNAKFGISTLVYLY